jgi:serine/threonine-protein kinase
MLDPRLPENAVDKTVDTKPCLLLIDDEERMLRSLSMLFRGQYRLHATTDPQVALSTLAREPVHVIVSDQRMPLMRGSDLLREVKRVSPATMRILLTGYSEVDAIVASVNEGEIFRYVNKPWQAEHLRNTVAQAAHIAAQMFEDKQRATAISADIEALPETTTILVIDDNAAVFNSVREIVGPKQPIYHAQNVGQAFSLLEREPIGVIISELVVGRESLTAMLKLLKSQHPEVVTIVMTPFRDTAVLVNLINQGQVYRILPKPMNPGPLRMNITSALRQHRLLRTSPTLRQRHVVERMSAPEELSVANRVMGLLGRLRLRGTA